MEKLILDANVLYSNHLRGLFLWMSWRGLFQIFWSQDIWDEVFRNYSSDAEKEEIFRQDVERVIWGKFPESMREMSQEFPPAGLPDASDEHVLALARQEEITNIVTFNLKDFPENILQEFGIASVHPDAFLSEFYEREKDETKRAIREHIEVLRKTKPRKAAYIQRLQIVGAERFAAQLAADDRAGILFDEVW